MSMLSMEYISERRKLFSVIAITLSSLGLLLICSCVLFTSLGSSEGPLIGLILSAAAVLISLTLAMLLLWLYNHLDPYEKEPMSLVLSAMAWGAVVATMFSCGVNTVVEGVLVALVGEGVAKGVSAALIAPVVEELFKALGVLGIFLVARHEVNSLLDGFLYGAMVGLGFTTVENISYILTMGVLPAGTLGFITMLLMRWLATPLLHQLTTAYFGISLAWGKLSGKWYLHLLGAFGGYVIAVLIHLLWNSSLVLVELLREPILSLVALIAVPALIYSFFGVPLAIIIWRSIKRERELIDSELRALTWLPEHIRRAVTDLTLRRNLKEALGGELGKRLDALLNGLAFWALLRREGREGRVLTDLIQENEELLRALGVNWEGDTYESWTTYDTATHEPSGE